MPTRPEPPGTPPPPEPGAALFCWAWWAALLIAALAFVDAFGPPVPIWDDFDVLPVLCGQKPLTLAYLWSQHSEHRIFLPRLILLAGYRATGPDFRFGMFASVALLAGAAGALLVALRLARGHTRHADALYPLLLLSPAHHENFLWSINLSFVLPIAIAAVVLALVIARPGWPGVGRGLTIGGLLALLPLCNAAGVALAPALALWLLVAAAATARTGQRLRAATLAVASLPALLLSALYFHDYQRPGQHPETPGLFPLARTSAQFVGMALGPATLRLGNGPGWILSILVVASGARLALAVARPSEPRPRLAGLLAFLAAVAVLVLGIGWGRSGMGDQAGAQVRYVTLAAPALLLLAAASSFVGAPAFRNLLPMTVFCALLGLLWPNTESALADGRGDRAAWSAFLAEIQAGAPRHLLVRRYVPFLHPSHDELARILDMLRAASLPPFSQIAPDPPLTVVPVPLEPVSVQLATWQAPTATTTGVDPYLVFDLPPSLSGRYIAGIRLRYDHHNPAGEPARFKLGWRRRDQTSFPADREYAQWALPTGDGRETVVWIADTADQIRIQPDNRPCTFTLHALDLLVP